MKTAIALFFGIGVSVLAVLWEHQRKLHSDLAAHYVVLSSRVAALAGLRTDNSRLNSSNPSTDQLARLRSDHEAVERLRSEINALEDGAAVLKKTTTPATIPQPPIPSLTDAERGKLITDNREGSRERQPRDTWHEEGTGTVNATFETILARAARHDVDSLSSLLVFELGNRDRAQALVERLPSDLRARYKTAESLIAAFLIDEVVPIDSMRISDRGLSVFTGSESVAPTARLMPELEIKSSDGAAAQVSAKPVAFSLRYQQDGWRLVVPYEAIAKYQDVLAKGGSPWHDSNTP